MGSARTGRDIGAPAGARVWRLVAAGAMATATVSAGSGITADASSYPPGDPAPTTVAAGGRSGFSEPGRTGSELAATGAESAPTLLIAGGAIVAGAGLLGAARLRRRPART